MATSDTPILGYNPSGGIPSGGTGTVVIGHFYYWPQIQNLTGGNPATDLDAQPIGALPVDALIEVVIPSRGASQWAKSPYSGAISSNTDNGTIVPIDYDPALNPWILYRQLGF